MLGKFYVFKFTSLVCILILLTACEQAAQPTEIIPASLTPVATATHPAPSPAQPEPSPETAPSLPQSEDGNFIEHQVAYGTFDYVSGLTLFDIDQDGMLDIIGSAVKEKEVAWWRNDGENPIKWEKQVIGKMDQGALYVHANDFDGDGDGDVVASGIFDNGTISLWFNEGGSPIEWRMLIVAENLEGPHGVYIKDMDQDGDQDIIANVGKANSIFLWENTESEDGQVSFVQHTITDDFNQNQSIMAIDLDEDGRMDILASALDSSEIAWWRNLGGNPITWEKQVIGSQFISAHWAEAGDMNGDGTLDVLGAAYSSNEIAIWYSSDETPIQWTQQVLTNQCAGALTVIPADLDDDGDLDIIATANKGHLIHWFRNDGGNPVQWQEQIIKSGFFGAWPVAAGDMDNDGDIDIVGGGDRMKTILFWENTLYSPENPKVIEIPDFTPLDPSLSYQEFPILTEDGVFLNGFAYQPEGGPAHQTAVFLGHEAGASHLVWDDFAQTLSGHGYLVLTIDFRGHSATGGRGPDFSTNGTDVRAVLDYLTQNGYHRVVCIGSSMGGTGCLIAAKTHEIAALGMLSSPKMIVRSAGKITKSDLASFDFPKIIAVAENDRALYNDPDFVKDILNLYDQIAEPKELILASDNGHGTELLFSNEGEYLKQALLEMIESVSD